MPRGKKRSAPDSSPPPAQSEEKKPEKPTEAQKPADAPAPSHMDAAEAAALLETRNVAALCAANEFSTVVKTLAALIDSLRDVAMRPSFDDDEVGFQRAVSKEYRQKSRAMGQRGLALVRRLVLLTASAARGDASDGMTIAALAGRLASGDRAAGEQLETALPLRDVADLTDAWPDVQSLISRMLELPETVVDHEKARARRGQNGEEADETAPAEVTLVKRPQTDRPMAAVGTRFRLQNAARLPKPQFAFKIPVDNTAAAPWRPQLHSKPNARVPLAAAGDEMADHLAAMALADELAHPYAFELRQIEYAPWQLEKRNPQRYAGFDATPFQWVDTPAALGDMMSHLQGATHVALDLENHSLRSYQGFVCLLQVSTRTHDFVVDALALRDELQVLNEVLTNPAVVKVLHGAESDVVWLQRDFGVYLVNMFDTYHASRVLGFERHGLVHLMRRYCPDVAMDDATKKAFQLSDWRVRPLAPALVDYARADTHYLLWIYDNLVNELVAEGAAPLEQVLERSRDTCLQVYAKPRYDVETGEGCGWKRDLARFAVQGSSVMTDEEMALFKAIHFWRDQTAREEDESPFFVMTPHMMLALVQRKPVDPAGVLTCCQPTLPLMRRNAATLAQLIARTLKDLEAVRQRQAADAEASAASAAEWEAAKARGPVHVTFPGTSAVSQPDGNNLSKDISGLWAIADVASDSD